MKNKTWEKSKMLFWGFLSMILIIILVLNFKKWIIYPIYHVPLYALFGDSLYFPFYLHIVHTCLFLLMILSLAWLLWANKNENKKSRIIGSAVFGLILIALVYFEGKDIYRDIVFIGKEKYLKTECRISSVHRHRGKGFEHYDIQGMGKVNGRTLSIEMNFYQYAALSKLKEAQDEVNDSFEVRFYDGERADSIITVYYLPHTERMLKYE